MAAAVRFETRGLLRGQYTDCAESRDVARGVVEPSPSSLGEEVLATGSTSRKGGLRWLRAAKGDMRFRETRCCSSLGVRLSVRTLPGELEVRDERS